MQPCRVEHWDAGTLGRWGAGALAEALQENSTGGPTLHRVVALLHAAHIPLRDDIEGVACGAMRYAVRTARPRLHAFGALKCMGPRVTLPCAPGTYGTQEAGMRSPYVSAQGRCHASLAS